MRVVRGARVHLHVASYVRFLSRHRTRPEIDHPHLGRRGAPANDDFLVLTNLDTKRIASVPPHH